MSGRRETVAFAFVLAAAVSALLAESLVGGKVLSPADVTAEQASFVKVFGPDYEPGNRLLIDPVLQFEPWLEFTRASLRAGRLPLWNPLAGCGAPLLANGQSAVFDPFHLVAYLGTLPEAHAPMAALRLWTAGLGMFLLARNWRLGRWGRWLAGFAFPFGGFLVGWLLYPPASVAVWMPWMILAGERAFDRPGPGSAGRLGAASALVLLGGHVQTSAHVFFAAGFVACWRLTIGPKPGSPRRALMTWSVGVGLGIAAGAVAFVPLGAYLTRSPVWGDRLADRASIWDIETPRLLDAACTAYPDLFGGQRRGLPNLGKALGVHNVNESAGGFAGLATLIWLLPVALAKPRPPRAPMLAALGAVGAMGAFGVPPLANLIRAVPVLDVIDHRRLTLWVGFALSLLGGIGLDRISGTSRGRGWAVWIAIWVLGALGLAAAGLGLDQYAHRLRPRIEAHFEQVEGAAAAGVRDPDAIRRKVDRQVRNLEVGLPRAYGFEAAGLLAMAAAAIALRTGRLGDRAARSLVFAFVVVDLIHFGLGRNPAIPKASYRPETPLIAHLRLVASPPLRVLPLGEELPPNMLMRYGLADARNYDSVELASGVEILGPLQGPRGEGESRTSRRPISWESAAAGQDRLRAAGVSAIVADEPPPPGAFEDVRRVGRSWVAPLDARAAWEGVTIADDGSIRVGPGPLDERGRRVLPLAFDPGWWAEEEGAPVAVEPAGDGRIALRPSSRPNLMILRYEPIEISFALIVSAIGVAAVAGSILSGVGPSVGRKNRRRGMALS